MNYDFLPKEEDIKDKAKPEEQQTPEESSEFTEEESQEEETEEQSEETTDETEEGSEEEGEETPQDETEESESQEEERSEETTSEEKEATPQDYTELLNEQLSERGLDKKFESIDDLVEAIKSKDEEPVEDERFKEIKSFVENGEGDLEEYLRVKTTDFKNMNEVELMRLEMQEEYPQLSSEEIDEEVRDRYGLDAEEGELDDREVKRHKRRLSMDAEKARKKNLQRQEKLTADLAKAPTKTQDEGPTQEQLDKFNQKVQETFDGSLQFENGFKYHVNEGTAKNIPVNIAETFDGEKGFDYNLYNKIRAFASNPDKVINAAIEHGKSQERETLKKERLNQNVDKGKKNPPKRNKPSSKKAIQTIGKMYNNPKGF